MQTVKPLVILYHMIFTRFSLHGKMTLLREAVVAGAKRYYVTHDSQEQHELNTACHYRGSIRDKPQFSVLLSTCSGRVR